MVSFLTTSEVCKSENTIIYLEFTLRGIVPTKLKIHPTIMLRVEGSA